MLSYREKLAAFLLYDENQPRDDNGRWSSGGGAPSPLSPEAARIVADVVRGGNWTIQHDKGDEYRIEPAHMPERIVTFTNRRGDTEYYDPELAHVVDDDVFEGAKTVRAKEGNHLWLEDVPGASKEDGYLYRGMSYAEWEQVQKDGSIKSSGTHNIGDQQAGLTYYSVDPAQASSYASGFAAWQYKPTFDRPGIVVRVKDPGTNVDVRGTDTSERGIPHDIPTSDIVDVFEAHPYALRPGTVQFVQSPHGEYHEGSRDTPSPHVVWKRTTRKYSLRFDPDQPRDDYGRWAETGGGGESSDAPAADHLHPAYRRHIAAREEEIRDDKYETVEYITPDGRKGTFSDNSPDSVVIPFTVDLTNATFTHNHPSGTSFSLDDIHFAAARGLKEIRATTSHGTFSFVRNGDYWPEDMVKTRHSINADVHMVWSERIKRGTLAIETANKLHADTVMRRLAKQLGPAVSYRYEARKKKTEAAS